MTEDELTAAFRKAVTKKTAVGTNNWLTKKLSGSVIDEYVKLIREQNPTKEFGDEMNLSLVMRVGASETAAGVTLQFHMGADYPRQTIH